MAGDNVLRPDYYNDEQMALLKTIPCKNVLEGVCKGSAIKYIQRAGHKPGEPEEKDIRKAISWLELYLENKD